MTRDLLFIVALLFVTMLLVVIGTRIYACHTLQKLYDELSMTEIDAVFGMKRAYAEKYVEVLKFRNSFYSFLSHYLKEDIFRCHHFFCKGILPDFCKKMDILYSR